MLKRVWVFGSMYMLACSCAYKPSMSPQFSKLTANPKVIENKNNYELHLDQPQDLEQLLYATNTRGKSRVKEGDFAVEFSKQEGRLTVELQSPNRDTIRLSNRQLYFKKTANFRDLGGITTRDGKAIHWGKIFRSGHLNQLKKRELKILEDLDIRTVVDLRTEDEITAKPDKYPPATRYLKYNAFEEEQEQLKKTRKAVFKGGINAPQATGLLKSFYAYYPTRDTEVIRDIVHELLNQDHAVLFHCSAGKDRTGIIGALILSILNVDRETIVQEYLLSNNYRQKRIEQQLALVKFGRLLYPGLNQEVVERFSWIDTAYLNESFDQIDAKYGSMDNYIRQALHISDQQRKEYIAKFTH